MKSEKSKVTPSVVSSETVKKSTLPSIFSGTVSAKEKKSTLTAKELRMQHEERQRKRTEKVQFAKKAVVKFLTTLFILTVIFSMILLPLLIVFG